MMKFIRRNLRGVVLIFFNHGPNLTYMNTYQNWYDLIDSISDVEVYGQVLYSYYVLQFLMSGLILCAVLCLYCYVV